MRPFGIMFHHFHGRDHLPGQGSIDADQLAGIIEHVGPARILPARDWLERALADQIGPEDVCVTFDDALRCQYDVALPVLERYGLTAFWFVYSSVMQGNIEPLEVYRAFRSQCFDDVDAFYKAFFDAVAVGPEGATVDAALEGFDPESYLAAFPFYTRADRRFRYVRDRVLNTGQYDNVMRTMMSRAGVSPAELAEGLWLEDEHLHELHRAGHVVGLHSHTHPLRVGELPAERQREEYSRNAAHLRAVIGEPPLAMSHPCNSYNDETLALLGELGIRVGFRANMAEPTHSALEYPREDHANLLAAMAAEPAAAAMKEPQP